MPFDWNNFLTLAQELVQDDVVESQRTAINRAYYAIFNPAVERAITRCGQPAGTKHVWCWERYSLTNDRLSRRLGAEGERLKKLRHKVDYEKNDIPKLKELAESTIEDAMQFQVDFAQLNARFPCP
jgi:uncharacterized protein (UPF0332 family)